MYGAQSYVLGVYVCVASVAIPCDCGYSTVYEEMTVHYYYRHIVL